ALAAGAPAVCPGEVTPRRGALLVARAADAPPPPARGCEGGRGSARRGSLESCPCPGRLSPPGCGRRYSPAADETRPGSPCRETAPTPPRRDDPPAPHISRNIRASYCCRRCWFHCFDRKATARLPNGPRP